jgi:membrane protein implicated in regulation of membrane protease activity
METWHLLMALGIIAFIVEIFTAGFLAGAIGIGFIVSAVGNLLGLSATWQISLFSLGLALTYFLIRPLMSQYGYNNDKIKTNRDALINRKGTVTEEINPAQHTGRVKIDGDDWKARSLHDEIIPLGTTVTVVDIESIVLIIKPLD